MNTNIRTEKNMTNEQKDPASCSFEKTSEKSRQPVYPNSLKSENGSTAVYDTVVVGGGAGGLYFGAAAPADRKTLILEKTKNPGTKLLMAGSGQCNVTHGGSIKEFLLCYGPSGTKIRSCLYKYNNLKLCDFLQSLSVTLTEREDGKIFPASMNAKDVKDALLSACAQNGVEIKTNAEVISISKTDTRTSEDPLLRFLVQTTDGSSYACHNLVIASGGASYPTTGSDGSFLKVLEKAFRLKIVHPRPALVPIYVENYPFSSLSGISFHNACIKIFSPPGEKKQKPVIASGDLLLTHKNFSGPIILNNSRYFFSGYRLEINFIFPYTIDSMISHLKESLSKNRKLISTWLGEEYQLPKRFISVVLDRIHIEDKMLASLSGKEIVRLAEAFSKAEFIVSGTGSFKEAMATAGGISLDEVKLSTMESRRIPGLYFVGEVLDIDGDTGGYNLQFAFSSAMTALSDMNSKKK